MAYGNINVKQLDASGASDNDVLTYDAAAGHWEPRAQGELSSVTLSGPLSFSQTVTPTSMGQIGLDTATGRILAFIGGASRSLAHTGEIAGGGASGLQLVESKYITSNTQVTTFSGLDGEADRFYFLFGRILNGTSTASYSIEPNGISTNQTSGWHNFNNSSAHAVGSTANLLISNGTPAATEVGFFGIISARKSFNRWVRLIRWANANNAATASDIIGRWTDTTTTITSLEIQSDRSDGMKAGSDLHLFKLVVG